MSDTEFSEDGPQPLVLLHGFGGTHHSWDATVACLDRQRYRPLAPDLPGHGAGGDMRPLTLDACARHVLELAPPRFALAGYSMGGRVALHVALSAPQRVRSLALISTTAGIEDADERARRRVADDAVADQFDHVPYAVMMARWRSQPLFVGEPPHAAQAAQLDQRRNDPHNIAQSLRDAGTGTMAPLWDRLGELTMPTLVLAGERDTKFVALGSRLAEALPHTRFQILPGGHALMHESPRALARALDEL
jgi:2-succinyl-6-hydroxy-2,4-cyclohexadiene-1-carboxylate synthase